jgi:hypothetical protein
MTDSNDRDPTAADDTTWLIADEPDADVPDADVPDADVPDADVPDADVVESSPARRRTALVTAGLIAAGSLAGGVAVAALRPHSSTTTASQTGSAGGQVPAGQVPSGGQVLPGQGQGGFGGGGGVDGEQRLGGIVTAVGGSSVTIRTASGTTAYAVTAQTEIVRNGALARLSAVRAGDSVFVHLIPGSGSSYVVERLFAQSGSASSSGNGSDDGSAGSAT